MERCTFELNDDKYVLQTLAANLSTLSIEELFVIGQQYIVLNRIIDAGACQKEIRDRINDRIQIGAMNKELFKSSARAYLGLTASTLRYDSEALVRQSRQHESFAPGLFRYFLRRLMRHEDVSLFFDLASCPMTYAMRMDTEAALVRTAAYAKAAIHNDIAFVGLKRHPLVGIWAFLQNVPLPSIRLRTLAVVPPRNTEYSPLKDLVREFFHRYLFWHPV